MGRTPAMILVAAAIVVGVMAASRTPDPPKSDERLKRAFKRAPADGWTYVHLEGTAKEIQPPDREPVGSGPRRELVGQCVRKPLVPLLARGIGGGAGRAEFSAELAENVFQLAIRIRAVEVACPRGGGQPRPEADAGGDPHECAPHHSTTSVKTSPSGGCCAVTSSAKCPWLVLPSTWRTAVPGLTKAPCQTTV